jgi:MFS family permease
MLHIRKGIQSDRMDKEKSPPGAQRAKSAIYYGYVIAVASFFILVMIHGVRFSYGVFFTPMARELGWNSATTSLVYAISLFVEGVFNFILGGLADRFGPKLVITLSGVLLALGYCLMPLVSSTWQFFLFYGLLVGAGIGGIFVPLVVLVARWFSARRNMMTGAVTSGVGIGMLIIAPVANHLITAYGWRITFLIMGIASLIVTGISAQFLKRDPAAMGLAPDGAEADTGSGITAPVQGLTFNEAIHTRQFWLAFFILFCYGFSLVAINIHIVPDAIYLGISAAVAAGILATIGGVQIIGRVGLGLAADKVGNRLIVLIGFIVTAGALFWIMSVNTTWAFFLFAVIVGLSQGGIASSQSPLVAHLFGLKSHGAIFGLCGFGFTFGSALGPYLTGYVFDVTGSYHNAFLACIIISLIGLVLILLVKPVKIPSIDAGTSRNSLN